MESEYLRTLEELEDISVELRQPYSSEGRIDNGCKILGCFTNEQDRRMGMSTYYATLKEKNKLIVDEVKKIGIECGLGERVVTDIIEKVDFKMSLLCENIRNIKQFSKELLPLAVGIKKKYKLGDVKVEQPLNKRNIVNSLQSYDILES